MIRALSMLLRCPARKNCPVITTGRIREMEYVKTYLNERSKDVFWSCDIQSELFEKTASNCDIRSEILNILPDCARNCSSNADFESSSNSQDLLYKLFIKFSQSIIFCSTNYYNYLKTIFTINLWYYNLVRGLNSIKLFPQWLLQPLRYINILKEGRDCSW